jgi:acetyltransferase-like isoleucine patch superfamily enzyme
MKANNLGRIVHLPAGLLSKLMVAATAGARDRHNKARFSKSIIDPGCSIDPSSEIDANCHIIRNSMVIRSSIRSYSYVGRNSIIQNAAIGSFCSIANDVFVGLGTHPTDHFTTSPLFYRTRNTFGIRVVDEDLDFQEYKPIEIGHDVWIGARAVVMDGVRIGHGAVIAANAVVTKDVPPYAIVGGVPAKLIKYRFPPAKIERLLASEWWLWPVDEIRRRMAELNQA